ncbi:hypothetical protein MML48_5g00002982 [Holotrichia oblita]|uniref:Uncharacterized protein n=1 Tax=Holotrichia oblita TaxID=644536 RepID=A0ACB9T4H7_HOLOL|nr:hypothetical protein MML48_5g00002982 [Holotrichia oblita]
MSMALIKICAAVAVISMVASTPSPTYFWKGTAFDSTVEEMRSMCNNNDAIACLKFKTITFLDNIFQKDSFKLSDNVEINRNSYRSNEITSRSDTNLEDKIEEYVKSHDFNFKLPFGSSVTLDAKNLDLDQMNLKLSFSDSSQPEARKSKLKKIFVPILIFILLKAMTLIPLALGVLGLKAWNALQLSFFSFIVSVGLAIFQMCKKLAVDNAAPQVSAHGAWDNAYNHYAARSIDVPETEETLQNAQNIAYSAYSQ